VPGKLWDLRGESDLILADGFTQMVKPHFAQSRLTHG
jgi:hypothetical protein